MPLEKFLGHADQYYFQCKPKSRLPTSVLGIYLLLWAAIKLRQIPITTRAPAKGSFRDREGPRVNCFYIFKYCLSFNFCEKVTFIIHLTPLKNGNGEICLSKRHLHVISNMDFMIMNNGKKIKSIRAFTTYNEQIIIVLMIQVRFTIF